MPASQPASQLAWPVCVYLCKLCRLVRDARETRTNVHKMLRHTPNARHCLCVFVCVAIAQKWNTRPAPAAAEQADAKVEALEKRRISESECEIQ